MIGLLLVVVLVSLIYETVLVCAVLVGARRRRAVTWPEDVDGAVGGALATALAVGNGAGVVARSTRLLASDHEREATGARISDAMVEGRLTIEEGVARIDAAYRARARAELAALLVDLPPRRQGIGRAA